jgi:mannose-6-phosphate isomerase
VTREAFAQAIEAGEVEPLLHSFEAKVGDCIFIPAGTVHAIGAGIVLAEVQQSSDATFRIHDWGRLGPDGKPLRLHLAEALEAIDFRAGPVTPLRAEPQSMSGGTREQLVHCQHFALERLRCWAATRVGSFDHFTVVVGLDGAADMIHHGCAYKLALGETILLPAEIGPCDVQPDGEVSILSCHVPASG